MEDSFHSCPHVHLPICISVHLRISLSIFLLHRSEKMLWTIKNRISIFKRNINREINGWECIRTDTDRTTDALWSITAKNTDCSTGSLARPFAGTTHSFACSGLLALFAPSTALTHLLARSLCSLPRSWDSEWLDGYFVSGFFYFWP